MTIMLLGRVLKLVSLSTLYLNICLGSLALSITMPFTMAHAGVLQVWPIEVSLASTGDVVKVNVKNSSGTDTFVQATVIVWPTSDGPGAESPTDDIIVSPPVFDLAAEDSQTIRLALRRPLEGDSERSYRLVVTELAKTAGLVPNTLTVAVSMRMPVFVTPPGALAKPNWFLVDTDFEGAQLVVANEGGAHINVKSISLLDADAQKPVFQSDQGGYVLAGGEKRWPIELALTELKGPMALHVDTDSGAIETIVSPPQR